MRWPGFVQNKNRISGDVAGAIFMVIAGEKSCLLIMSREYVF